MATRQLAIYALVISSTVLSGCESIEAPSRAGRVALNVIVSTGACGPLHSGRVEIRGPTERTVTIAPGATDTIGNLLPGAYTVGLEGLFSGEVDCFGQSAGVQVVAGQTTTAAVTLASFVSSVTQVVQSPGTKSFTVNVGPVASAASYEVEAATDSAFTVNHVVQLSTQTSVVITVPASGLYLVRARAIDPYQALGRPSMSQVFAVTCNCWTTKTAMPSTPRRQLGVGVVNAMIYAVGGWNGGNLTTVEAYEPGTNAWTVKAAMPTPRRELAAGVVNGVLYAVGGYNTLSLATVQAYDPVSNTWTDKAAMPTARHALAVGAVNDLLYAVGGDNGSFLTTVQAYDPVTNTWTSKAPMPTARRELGVGVVNGVLYAVGGYGGGGYKTEVEAYDPVTNTWTSKAPMPTPSAGLAVGVVNGVLYAVGGDNGAAGPLATVQAYDPATDTWTVKTPVPTARVWLAVGVLNGALYAVGGSTGAGVTSTVEAYDP